MYAFHDQLSLDHALRSRRVGRGISTSRPQPSAGGVAPRGRAARWPCWAASPGSPRSESA